ncbi:hypothetical protein VP01_3010g1 [Puccinia sorghi]|uniref:Uncharacterized protein n=1 Tax=Puccinia sorghi TaxID=27349 RepID=A0A0L6V218_9BASI|nr:hypothetical protein VP01_3010g1 [Puccinia sorghi]
MVCNKGFFSFHTNEDHKVGISTIDDKLESLCPHYHAMNELMGG